MREKIISTQRSGFKKLSPAFKGLHQCEATSQFEVLTSKIKEDPPTQSSLSVSEEEEEDEEEEREVIMTAHVTVHSNNSDPGQETE